jgi:hypothetical protein
MKSNPELHHEFAMPRYLWHFSMSWHRAKVSNTMPAFWSNIRTSLETYDVEWPTGRRLEQPQNNFQKKASTAQSIPIATPIAPTGQAPTNSLRASPTSLSPAEQHLITRPAAQTTLPTLPTLPKPRPGPPPGRTTVIQPPPEATRNRIPSPSPVAGSSQVKKVVILTPSPVSDDEYVEGRRIPGWPTLLREQRMEYDPSSLSDASEYLPVIKVKHGRGGDEKTDEGKGKMKEEGNGLDKKRKPPQPTGKLREPECKRCVEKGVECYTQEVGKACLGCAKMKIKCLDSVEIVTEKGKGVKTGPPTGKKPKARVASGKSTPPPPKRSQGVKPAPVQPSKPAPKATAPAKKGTRQSIPITLSPSPLSISDGSESPVGSPKRTLRSQNLPKEKPENRPGPSRSAGSRYTHPVYDTNERDRDMEDLTSQVTRHREIIDGILPAYVRIREAIDSLQLEVTQLRRKVRDHDRNLQRKDEVINILNERYHDLRDFVYQDAEGDEEEEYPEFIRPEEYRPVEGLPLENGAADTGPMEFAAEPRPQNEVRQGDVRPQEGRPETVIIGPAADQPQEGRPVSFFQTGVEASNNTQQVDESTITNVSDDRVDIKMIDGISAEGISKEVLPAVEGNPSSGPVPIVSHVPLIIICRLKHHLLRLTNPTWRLQLHLPLLYNLRRLRHHKKQQRPPHISWCRKYPLGRLPILPAHVSPRFPI